MRDQIQNKNYFVSFNNTVLNEIQKSKDAINSNSIPIDNVETVRKLIFEDSLKVLISQYGIGAEKNNLSNYFDEALSVMVNGWDDSVVKFHKGRVPVYYDQYWLDEYSHMLWMLSFAILLEVETAKVKKLADLIDNGNISDYNFEYFLSHYFENRKPESAKRLKYKPYSSLYKVLEQPDSKKSEKLLKSYVESWYKKSNLAYWYENHLNKHNVYFGYWCFEAAAVVKIKGLDDSSFRDNQYYPKDMLS